MGLRSIETEASAFFISDVSDEVGNRVPNFPISLLFFLIFCTIAGCAQYLQNKKETRASAPISIKRMPMASAVTPTASGSPPKAVSSSPFPSLSLYLSLSLSFSPLCYVDLAAAWKGTMVYQTIPLAN